ncbi:MAG: D-alanyl-D-alanine carboxypeptidase [Burkholderiales bacterium]|nr:D-alanyl-D-alanine carboxypeptidase [Burkholderiales bacterium]
MRLPLLVLLACASFPAAAQAPALAVPAPPVIAARAWVLHDFTSEQTLAARAAQARVEPASLTKLMTAYLVFSALKQKTLRADQRVPVSQRAWKAEGSRMFIAPDRPVTVDELVRGVVVHSGNDASIALAEAVSGGEEAFAQAMNREAQRLGMKDTHFVNATGLPHPQHYSTAHDLALLAVALIRDFPEYYPLYSQKQFRYHNVTQSNRNRLLWSDPTVDGVKTGYTENAGYCLVSSARRGGRRLVAVVLGAASDAARAAESQKLLNHGFQAYDGVRLYAGGDVVTTIRVWKGAGNEVKAGFSRDLHLALPKGGAGRLRASVDSLQPLLAPVRAGQRVGTLKLTIENRAYGEFPVVALQDVPLAGIFGRGWDAIRLFFQ